MLRSVELETRSGYSRGHPSARDISHIHTAVRSGRTTVLHTDNGGYIVRGQLQKVAQYYGWFPLIILRPPVRYVYRMRGEWGGCRRFPCP